MLIFVVDFAWEETMPSLAQSSVRAAVQPSPRETNWFAANWGLLWPRSWH
jgi:hypothetical protein